MLYVSRPEENSPELVKFFEAVHDNRDTVLHMPNAVTWPVYDWNDVNRHFNSYATKDNIEIIKDTNKISVPVQKDTNNWMPAGKIDRGECRKILNEPNTGFVFIQGCDYHSPFIANMCANLEMIFNGVAGAHVYGGVSETYNNSSFAIHWDKTLNVILQLDGESHWTVYDESGEEDKTITEDEATPVYSELLAPGDLLYIPAGRYHKCVPKSRRLSLSFCCIPNRGQVVRELHVL